MGEHIRGEHGGSSIANALRKKLKVIRQQLNQKSNDFASIFSLWYKSRSKPTEAELLVLICSIFPDDYRIPIHDLVTYWMGLDLFEDNDMFATRCRVHDIISIINDKKFPRKATGGQIRLAWEKDGPLDQYVKVLVGSRDIAKSVARRYPLLFRREIVIGEWHESSWYKDCYGLSLVLKKVIEYPVNLEFPNLTLLQLQYREDSQSIPTDFFKRMEKLCVLSLDLPSLPHSLNVLRNLKTLRLKVPKFEDMSWIGGLTKLEFLSISVLSLTDIPSELGQLENLRLLDLRKMNIAYIPPSVLSRLLKLEELYLPLNFQKWGYKAKKYDDFDEWESGEQDNCEDEERVDVTSNEMDGVRINASLIDIASLSLNALQICVPKASLFPKKSSIFKSVREFNIFLPYNALYQSFGKYSTNVLQLTGEACDIKESGTCDLLSKVEDFSLTRVRNLRNVISQLEDSGFPQLKKMAISECNGLEYIVETTEKQIQSEGDYMFRKLEYLHLSMLSNLEEICHERWTNLRWFSNLSQISIRFCPKLTYMLPLSIVRGLTLKSIEILDCYEMKGIIYGDEEDIPQTLCSIEKLDLHSLPRLKRFFVHKDDNIDGVKNDINQSLSTNEIVSSYMDGSISTFAKDCKSSRTRENIGDEEIICSSSNSTSLAKAQNGYQEVLVVKNEDVANHMEMSSAFSSRIAVKWFQNLRSLKIAFCDLVKVVFLYEENHDSSKAFNSLEVLELHGLRNLVHTWFQIPPKVTSFKKLRLLVLSECGSLYLFSFRVAKLLVQLQKVYISRCEKMEEIIIGENAENEEQGKIVLPRLKLLEIQHMPNLKILFGMSCEIDLPLLESLKLKQCNKMKSISNGTLRMPMLKCIEVDGSFHLLTKDQTLISTGLATPHDFTYADLKIATKDFSPNNFLGEEGIAKVYKGWVDRKTFVPSYTSSGMLVSVKRYKILEVFPYNWVRARMQREVGILRRQSHPNLVKLLGYCLEDEESFLVYRFIPGGTLYDYLFKRNPGTKPLSWDIRIKTAIGAARGINYLHTSEPQVIHKDIRADKILLDTDHNSKLADFGLAIWGPSGGDSHLIPTNFNAKIFDVDLAKMIRFRQPKEISRSVGTNSYIAPEMFHASDYHSVETDVYSFGVVLLELMTGLKVSQLHQKCQLEHKLSLAKWLELFLSQERELNDIVDSLIIGQYASYEMLLMAKLTLYCIEDDPKLRPTMGQVLEKLQEIDAVQQKRRQ